MSLLVDGVWRDQWYDTSGTGGRFERSESPFRNWVTPDGAPGPTGEGGFAAEPGLPPVRGARLPVGAPGDHPAGAEGIGGRDFPVRHPLAHGRGGLDLRARRGGGRGRGGRRTRLYEVYLCARPDHSGRVTVPVLWDEKRGMIVSNESADIVWMLNSAFDGAGAREGDLYPEALRPEIDALNARVYATVNNGVYRAGFATTQDAYAEALQPLFETLDWLERRLGTRRYLCGARITEADWRLITTLLRFDPVYHYHFKCNLRRPADHPNLWGFTRELFRWPGVRDTVDFGHIKRHYYGSHPTVNPTGIVPEGPVLDFDAPHGRG